MEIITKDRKRRVREFDKKIGEKLRNLRIVNGYSSIQLAALFEVTPQQISKYERGQNRLSLSTLLCFLQKTNSSLIEFCSDLENEESIKGKRLHLEFFKNYYKISNPKIKKVLNDLVRTFSEEE